MHTWAMRLLCSYGELIQKYIIPVILHFLWDNFIHCSKGGRSIRVNACERICIKYSFIFISLH